MKVAMPQQALRSLATGFLSMPMVKEDGQALGCTSQSHQVSDNQECLKHGFSRVRQWA
jgi:hypothetical protein